MNSEISQATIRRCPTLPHNAWYAAATSADIGRTPLAREVLGTRVVLYRTTGGKAVALEDRCRHKPVPLSTGRLRGDNIIAGYTGFEYGSDGTCVRVPTQEHVPFEADVRAFPIVEDGSFVWVWVGEPALAALRPAPQAPWLLDPQWVSFGDSWVVEANIRLLWNNFADITHVANLHPEIAPPALTTGHTPPLEVTVSETGMHFQRSYAPAPLSDWHAQLIGVDATEPLAQREEGAMISPGLWVDHWHVEAPNGQAKEFSFIFTHALTPIDETSTRHVWRVSRNFADSAAATGTLQPIFRGYYEKVREAMQTMQAMIDSDGDRQQVLVAADAGAEQVHKIVDRLVADETGVR